MDWCRLGEVSAPYDELLGSADGRAPAAGDVAGDWREKDEGVSLLSGGETDWVGVGGDW